MKNTVRFVVLCGAALFLGCSGSSEMTNPGTGGGPAGGSGQSGAPGAAGTRHGRRGSPAPPAGRP